MWHDVTSCCLFGRLRQSNQRPRRDGHRMLKIWASAFPSSRPFSEKKKRRFPSVSRCMSSACTDPSICCISPTIHPSMHACMHACIQLAKRKQTDSQMYAPRATWILTWIAWIAQGYHSFFCFSFVFQPGFVAFVAFVASGFCGFCGCAAFVALPCLSYLSTYLSDLTCFNLT